jgi:hypothetical protein
MRPGIESKAGPSPDRPQQPPDVAGLPSSVFASVSALQTSSHSNSHRSAPEWLPRPGLWCLVWMTSDSVGKAKALELYGHRRTNSLTISSVSVRHFRPYPTAWGSNWGQGLPGPRRSVAIRYRQ